MASKALIIVLLSLREGLKKDSVATGNQIILAGDYFHTWFPLELPVTFNIYCT
jgi:hypothetical protein